MKQERNFSFRSRLVVVKNKKSMIIKFIWIFIIGCFLGCLMETFLCYFQRGHFESRQGLIYGPFTPVYGFGAVLYTFIVERWNHNGMIFLVSMIAGGGFEYLASLIQEIMFGTISWDYSNYFLNFNGRTSFLHMIGWGILGLIFARIIYPWILELLKSLKSQIFTYITYGMAIFMIFNMTISTIAGIRQEERLNGIPANSQLQLFFDHFYPDELMDRIYPNKKIVKK